MKQRIEGRNADGRYRVHGIGGSILVDVSHDDARGDRKLRAAIKRNGWEAIPEG